MGLVPIYGSVWDHSRTPISGVLQPRLFAVPKRAAVARALMVAVEVKCELNVGTGQFSVMVESEPGLSYGFRMDWLVPGQEEEPPERRARAHEEWPISIIPGDGGLIGDLTSNVEAGAIYAGLGKPDAGVSAWFDMTDENEDGVMLYATEGTV